jgi:hypothetical protein
MASTSKQPEKPFSEAVKYWNLENLYTDLAAAKGKSLTPTEKKFLRGLLCGYSPADIAHAVYQTRDSKTVRFYLSSGLYRYIEALPCHQQEYSVKIKNWNCVVYLLEKAGYKNSRLVTIGNVSSEPRQKNNSVPSVHQRCDWGEAIDVSRFYGRSAELTMLENWVVQDNCRLLGVLGMGGIGKTALSVKLAQQMQNQFEYVVWRSLRYVPLLEDFLADLLVFFSHQPEINVSTCLGQRVSQLMKYLRHYRCLLVIDSVEAILISGEVAGYYQSGYENYGELFRCMGEISHKSTVVLTSREKPEEIASKEGQRLPVRSLCLTGLQQEAKEILQGRGLVGSSAEYQQLINCYGGNPQALMIAAATIQVSFDGKIAEFLTQCPAVYGGIRKLLDQQFARLSDLEKQIMYCLAMHCEGVSISQLQEDVIPPVSLFKLIEALDSLGKRSLIERHSTYFTQQPLIREYVTKHLVELVRVQIPLLKLNLAQNGSAQFLKFARQTDHLQRD